MHYKEARKPTNTGKLVARAIDGSTITYVGAPGRVTETVTAPDRVPLLLFPGAEATPLDQLPPRDNYTLIVPDGNWRQASKIAKRTPGLVAALMVTLPEQISNEAIAYQLRDETKERGLATGIAIAYAMRWLEAGSIVSEQLLRLCVIAIERTLWLRGTLAADRVTGGIPRAAIDFYRLRSNPIEPKIL